MHQWPLSASRLRLLLSAQNWRQRCLDRNDPPKTQSWSQSNQETSAHFRCKDSEANWNPLTRMVNVCWRLALRKVFLSLQLFSQNCVINWHNWLNCYPVPRCNVTCRRSVQKCHGQSVSKHPGSHAELSGAGSWPERSIGAVAGSWAVCFFFNCKSM